MINRRAGLFAAVLIGLIVAALATVCLGMLLIGVSMMLIMPQTMWAGPLLLGLLFAVFAVTFIIVFREMKEKFTD